jgi:hypothetical protein
MTQRKTEREGELLDDPIAQQKRETARRALSIVYEKIREADNPIALIDAIKVTRSKEVGRALKLELLFSRPGYHNLQGSWLHHAPIQGLDIHRRTENKRRGIQPDWSGVVCLAEDFEVAIAIDLIDTPAGMVSGHGMGRRAVMGLQQAIANQEHEQVARLEAWRCYLPTFILTDSLYGWTKRAPMQREQEKEDESRKKKDDELFEAVSKAPPFQIFPPYLHVEVDGDPDETQRRFDANERAIYYPIDLCWLAPRAWDFDRLSAAIDMNLVGEDYDIEIYHETHERLVPMLRDVLYTPASLYLRPSWAGAEAAEKMKFYERVHAKIVVRYRPFYFLDKSGFDLDAIAAILRSEGNHDEGNDASTLPCLCVEWADGVEVPMTDDWTGRTIWFVRLVLAHLLDYSRVMWRPMLLSKHLLVQMKRAIRQHLPTEDAQSTVFEPSSNQAWRMLMPAAAPTLLNVEGGDWVMWVPTFKEGESQRDGLAWTARHQRGFLPRERQTRLFLNTMVEKKDEKEEKDEERESKRPRLGDFLAALTCDHCSRPNPAFADSLRFFCHQGCQESYYHSFISS